MKEKNAKDTIRKSYGRIAKTGESCCDLKGLTKETEMNKNLASACCSEEIQDAVSEADMGLGCGNPTAIAELKENEIVLDIGAGGGIDCFLASKKVGKDGKVIGVDVTPEMVEKANGTAGKYGYENVEFKLGEIENLPIDDNSIDVVISNCVINLSLNKAKVFQEIFRVLKPGGRIAISDIGLLRELPQELKESEEAYVSCIGGALLVDEYQSIVKKVGFQDVRVSVKGSSFCSTSDTGDPFGRDVSEEIEKGDFDPSNIAAVYVEGKK